MNAPHNPVRQFFRQVVSWPKTIIALGVLGMVVMGAFIPTIVKDTTSEAFVPKDNPALIYRDKVKATFGLKDPMVIAVINSGETGVFNPDSLNLVAWLTEQVEYLDGIDPDRVTSLATENNISGHSEGMDVEPFFEDVPQTAAEAEVIWRQIQDFPLYQGTLVANDGSATLIIAELVNDADAQPIYTKLLDIAEQAPTGPGDEVHVAGQGAVSGYLATYIDRDAQRLNPFAALIITVILFIAYRSLRATILPNLIVLATVAGGLGSMAALGVPFYVITGSLPVILIGIAVADSIHIFSQYYEEMAQHPERTVKDNVISTMEAMWRPISLTSVTTIAGFVGLSAAASLPPMQAYGIFAAVGIGVAWLYSLLFLPACLALLKPQRSRAYRPAAEQQIDVFTAWMSAMGRFVVRHPKGIVATAAGFALVATVGALQVIPNEERIDNFQTDEAIYIADKAINAAFDGTYYLDVAIDTPAAEDLFKPENLRRIETLQQYMESIDGIENTVSIVDYLKQMNRALNDGDPSQYRLPDNEALVAQYFLIYASSSDPTDFEEEVDYDYRLAHVRGQLKSDNYQFTKPIVEQLSGYIEQEFNTDGIHGEVTGSVNLSVRWLDPLEMNHYLGVAIALLLVLTAAAYFFKSVVAGLLATLPVAFSVLLIYAIMGYTGIWLGIGTSMFAAIAIGLGVDFAIHTVDRLRHLVREQHLSIEHAIARLFPSTGRALLFNLAALALGFGVLVTSVVPPLQNFGMLTAAAVLASFIASLVVLPAIILITRPQFIHHQKAAAASELQPAEII